MVFTVNGHEIRIPSVSASSVSRDSLSGDFPSFERRYDSTAWGDLICLSQTSLMWLAAGGFLIHLFKSPPRLHERLNPLIIHFFVCFLQFVCSSNKVGTII